MKRRVKKTAIILVILGILIMIPGIFIAKNYFEVRNSGVPITGTITRIISINDSDGSDTYKPVISYSYKNQDAEYIPNSSSSMRNYSVGDTRALYVSSKGVVYADYLKGLLGAILFGGFGLLMLIIGTIWFHNKRKHYNEQVRLKRYGNRVQARFVRSEKSNMKVNQQYGTIIYLQQENSEKIFQTHPIYADFSASWLESHSFDVYIDPKDESKYFIDIEKLFGHTISH